MNTRDYLIEDFTADYFQQAFKLYFEELGIHVTRWDELFDEMNHDPEGKDYAYVRMTEDRQVIGFIQFTALDVKSWFFETKIGFVREFWIAKEYRGLGHGTELLTLAEDYFRNHRLFASILTTDTAEAFYEKRGYVRADEITAKNKDAVFVKKLDLN